MIEINLLPAELRKKDAAKFSRVEFSPKIIFLGLSLLLLPDLIIILVILTKSLLLWQINSAFKKIEPHKAQIDEIIGLTQKSKSLQELFPRLNAARPAIAMEMNAIANLIPKGVWLNELSFSQGNWEIKGSCFSISSSEMAQIGKFVNALKAEKKMAKEFAGLELASAQRKALAVTEIVDFVISSKTKEPALAKDKKKAGNKKPEAKKNAPKH